MNNCPCLDTDLRGATQSVSYRSHIILAVISRWWRLEYSYLGGNENVLLSVSELIQSILPHSLGLVSVDTDGAESLVLQDSLKCDGNSFIQKFLFVIECESSDGIISRGVVLTYLDLLCVSLRSDEHQDSLFLL